MKNKLIFILILLPLYFFGNMAQPWIEGAEHSTLYGAVNCKVIKEKISISFFKENEVYHARYKINYLIYSSVNQSVPLLFVGLGLSEKKSVKVNSAPSIIKLYDKKDSEVIYYSKTYSLAVPDNQLIYFNADLKKGSNMISVEYEGNLEYNTVGFVRVYKLKYSLFPSKFWESFGTIDIEVLLPEELKIKSSNIGGPLYKNGKANFSMDTIYTDEIEIEVSKKISFFAQFLLILQPFGIAVLIFLPLLFYHIKFIILKFRTQNPKYKYVLFLGNFLIPILFYVIFFLAFDLIDLSLGQKTSKHGYVFLFIFTFPIFLLIYSGVMWYINRHLKEKIKTNS